MFSAVGIAQANMRNGEMPQEDSVGALIAMEAKGIQTWIFAGGKLRDLAGGSDALEQIPITFLNAALTACGIALAPDERKLGEGRWVPPAAE
jgi:hypothetical protein